MVVYPRVGGGNFRRVECRTAIRGLSPRGRGKLRIVLTNAFINGSIPAWAGETPTPRDCAGADRVYPRVGGGNPAAGRISWMWSGLSPRGRGKPAVRPVSALPAGSIPAWAGETSVIIRPPSSAMVYPRVGGGNRNAARCSAVISGLSPRGRGKPIDDSLWLAVKGSIPAWAGETQNTAAGYCRIPVYPRVGGGNAVHTTGPARIRGLSPRGRGKRRPCNWPGPNPGSIPAWAGETRYALIALAVPAVYPRVGGGNPTGAVAHTRIDGLSPRGRGKLRPPTSSSRRKGSIPAWAGETLSARPANRPAPVYPRVGGGNSRPMM